MLTNAEKTRYEELKQKLQGSLPTPSETDEYLTLSEKDTAEIRDLVAAHAVSNTPAGRKKITAASKMANTADVVEATKRYAEAGIIVHPLQPPTAECKGPGKAPLKDNWHKRTSNTNNLELEFRDGRNIGFICGKVSDLTVVDIDWDIPGIRTMMLNGVDHADFVLSSHTRGRGHMLFRYSPELQAVRGGKETLYPGARLFLIIYYIALLPKTYKFYRNTNRY